MLLSSEDQSALVANGATSTPSAPTPSFTSPSVVSSLPRTQNPAPANSHISSRPSLPLHISRVPVELYREIVQHINPGSDKPTLRSLCLVSQTVRSEAERHLYGKLDVKHPQEVALLCDLIASSRRLAKLVGELTIVTADVPKADFADDDALSGVSGETGSTSAAGMSSTTSSSGTSTSSDYVFSPSPSPGEADVDADFDDDFDLDLDLDDEKDVEMVDDETLEDAANTVNPAQTLLAAGALAPFSIHHPAVVAHRAGQPDTYTTVNWTSPSGAHRYWHSIARALRTLPNLHTLTLAADRNLQFAWVLRGTTFRLKRFCGYMAWDLCLQSFLEEQKSIVDLELLCDSSFDEQMGHRIKRAWGGNIAGAGGSSGPHGFLPNVIILRVCILDLDMASKLIQHRPVKCLMITTAALHDLEVQEIARELGTSPGVAASLNMSHMGNGVLYNGYGDSSGSDSDEEDEDRRAGSVGPVKALTIDFGDDKVSTETLDLLAERFPYLEFLGTVPYLPEDEEEFLESIQVLRHLQTIIINNRDRALDPRSEFDLACSLRMVCPELKIVGFSVQHGGAVENECFVWDLASARLGSPVARATAGANARYVIRDNEEMWLSAGAPACS